MARGQPSKRCRSAASLAAVAASVLLASQAVGFCASRGDLSAKVDRGELSDPGRRLLLTSGLLLGPSLGWGLGAVAAPSPKELIDEFLDLINVFAVTDPDGAVALEVEDYRAPSNKLGRFYLSEEAANEAFKKLQAEREGVQKLEVRKLPLNDVYLQLVVSGKEEEIGGKLRLEPMAREVRNAAQIMQGASLGPPGTVPLFLCPELELSAGTETFVPAFLREKDLRTTLAKAGVTKPEPGQVQVTSLQEVTRNLARGKGAAPGEPRLRALASIENVKDVTK